jgi:membrane protein required for colicin V production
MTLFDIVVGLFLLLFLIKGIIKGFVNELSSLAALVLGVIVAVKFSGVAAVWLSGYVTSRFISALAFILVFIAVVVGVHLLGKMIDKLMKAIALGWLNRIFGGLFGLLKAAFFVSAIVIAVEVTGFSNRLFSQETRSDSYLFQPVQRFAPAVLNLLEIKIEHLVPQQPDEFIVPPVVV